MLFFYEQAGKKSPKICHHHQLLDIFVAKSSMFPCWWNCPNLWPTPRYPAAPGSMKLDEMRWDHDGWDAGWGCFGFCSFWYKSFLKKHSQKKTPNGWNFKSSRFGRWLSFLKRPIFCGGTHVSFRGSTMQTLNNSQPSSQVDCLENDFSCWLNGQPPMTYKPTEKQRCNTALNHQKKWIFSQSLEHQFLWCFSCEKFVK